MSTVNTLRYITICKCHRKRLTDEERPLTTDRGHTLGAGQGVVTAHCHRAGYGGGAGGYGGDGGGWGGVL